MYLDLDFSASKTEKRISVVLYAIEAMVRVIAVQIRQPGIQPASV